MPHMAQLQGPQKAQRFVYSWRMGKKPEKSQLSKTLRPVLADNLDARMGVGKDRKVLRAIGGISASQMGRIVRQESAATIDALAEIAKGLGCKPWELLIPLGHRVSDTAVHYEAPPANAMSAGTPQERSLLTNYRNLQKKERDVLATVAEALVVKMKAGLGPYPFVDKAPTAARKKPGKS